MRKEEGVTFDPDHNRLYVAISEISYGMEDKASKGKESAKYDVGGSNDIKVAYNPCGGVLCARPRSGLCRHEHEGDRRRQAQEIS